MADSWSPEKGILSIHTANSMKHLPTLRRNLLLLYCVLSLSACASTTRDVQKEMLRNASFAGVEAQGLVGKQIADAIEKYGNSIHSAPTKSPTGTMFRDVDLHGKTVYVFEQSRTNDTVDDARGIVDDASTRTGTRDYARKSKFAMCEIGFVVEPYTLRILTYDIRGNCR
jgi:hypothetical protein